MIEVAEKNKKKIVMFIQRGIFTAGLIELLECYFSQYYSFVFYTVKDDRFPLVERRSKIYEIDNTNIFLDEIKKIECDGIIISGLYFNPLPFNYKMDECVAKKLFVDFWGGDYTCFRIRYFFEDPYAYLVARRKLRIVRACGGWILEMQGDYPEICRHALCRKPNYVAPILTPGDIEEKELKITRIREDGNSTVNIQLGNSAAKENCHIAILRRLSHLKTENIKIYCPLSYSRTGAYADRVEKIGAKIFGDKFIPIKEFMSKEDYFESIKQIDVAIYNNNRQQGMGNIEEMLRQGKKVYLRKTTPMWKWYTERGQKIFDVKMLKNVSLEELLAFKQEDALRNLEADRE